MYHLRLATDVSKVIKAQADRCGVSANALSVILLSAVAETIRNYHGPLLPPTFELASHSRFAAPDTDRILKLNESAKTKSK